MTDSKPTHIISIVYVLLLSLGPLFSIVWLVVSPVLPTDPTGSGSYDNATINVSILFGPIGLYICACFVLGIVDIVRSFRAFKAGQEDFCLTSMLIHKYGLVAFFILNFILCTLIIGGSAFAITLATRGAGLLFSPMFFFMGACATFLSYLGILPGSFYGIQTIRFARLRGFATTGMAVVHAILQFLFLTDVLDAMFLSAVKWGRSKKMAVVIGIVYLLFFLAVVALFIFLLTQLFAA